MLRSPQMGRIPLTLGAALFCVAVLSGALVAHGTAYIGRFSTHLMPVAAAIAVCFSAVLFDAAAKRPR